VQFTFLHSWEEGKMTVLENDGRNKLPPLPLAINCVEIEHLKEEQLRRKMKKRSNYARFIARG
jgi:hypothetical protein